MDIVDIDKVLDDLELNEDQHSRTIKNEITDITATVASCVSSAHHEQNRNSDKCHRNDADAIPSQTHCYQNVQQLKPNGTPPMVPSSYTNHSPHGGHSTDMLIVSSSGCTTSIQQAPPLNRMTKTNYVNVSNVFLSLNEYMNAGVQAVKIAEESSPTLDNTSVDVASIDENEISNTINGTDVIESMPTNEQVTLSQTQQDTSSSSSPSSRLLDTGTNTIDQPNTSATNDNQSLNDSNSAVNDASVASSSLSILPPTSLLVSNDDSSIIQPTSSASQSNTIPAVSSDEKEECDENLNSENSFEDYRQTNDSASLDERDQENFKDCASEMVTHEPEVLHEKVDTDSEDVGAEEQTKNIVVSVPVCAEDVEKEQNDRFIKPLCFEAAATMDDVSDTELESYLQELEDLEASPDIIRVENATATRISSRNPDIKDTGSAPESDVDDPIPSSHSDTDEDDDEVEDVENPMIVKDDRNADSFSQASTVEFADINADSDTQLIFAIDKNEQKSDSDDHERDTDPCTPRGIDRRDSEICAASEPIDGSEHKLEDAVAASEAKTQIPQITPKRPNTLELPSSFNESGRKMEVMVTPGTDLPSPANQMIDATSAATSCSSSDESNMMLTDTSIRSEDATHSQCDSDADIGATVAASSSNDVIASSTTSNATTMPTDSSAAHISINNLGKVQPYWIPDNMTMFCMQCNQKFSFIKRRHHCRACGQVLCSTCCSLKAKLEYMGDVEARICVQCDLLLNNGDLEQDYAASGIDVASALDANAMFGSNAAFATRSPNPNNPMEYCSVIPPLQQVASGSTATPISVMVPVGVLKREGAPPKTARKEVMFSDGIRPGCDLTELDNSWTPTRSGSSDGNGNVRKSTNRRVQTPPGTSF